MSSLSASRLLPVKVMPTTLLADSGGKPYVLIIDFTHLDWAQEIVLNKVSIVRECSLFT